MRPLQFWMALFVVAGIVMVAPAWTFFSTTMFEDLPTEVRFLGALVLPFLILLTGASWIDPG